MSRPTPVAAVEATISAAEARATDWEAIAIRAGPAGGAVALRQLDTPPGANL